MLNILLDNIVAPLIRRSGTALSTYIVANNLASPHDANIIVNGLVVLFLVSCDLILSSIDKRKK